ncbi:MAG: hypothetical protein U0Q18_34215 [Bryobacteraceae bacterium]
MSLINWGDPDTYWLTVTNIALGAIVLICFAVAVGGVAHEFVSRFRKRRRIEAEIDRDMRLLDDHAFDIPGFGITMADGGEKLPPKKEGQK